MKKKVLSIALAICMTFGSAAALPQGVFSDTASISASAETSGKYNYKVLDDGTAEITEYTGSDSNVTIPSTLGGKKVTVIGYRAFFYNADLTSVTIPDTVKTIDMQGFYKCENLKSVTIPKGVTTIGASSFYGCSSLTSIVLPSTVTSIGSDAFYLCKNLKSVSIPSSVNSIGGEAFAYTQWLKDMQNKNPFVIINGILINGEKCTGMISVPSGVHTIAALAFGFNQNITSVIVTSGVKTISESAFVSCKNLKEVSIPSSATDIKGWAFARCSSLRSVVLPEGITSIGDCTFMGCTSLESVNIPKTVTAINEFAFKDCESLKSITIPNSVTIVNSGAFEGCKGLTSIVIPDSVTALGREAFIDCEKLKSVTLPKDLKTIETSTFEGCSSLTEVTIPNNVRSIGKRAFANCAALKKITIPGRVDFLYEDIFADTNCTIYCYKDSPAHKYAVANNIAYKLLECTKHENVTQIVIEPTCLASGRMRSTCQICGLDVYESVPALGHKWNAPTYTWSSDNKTCTAKRTCKNNSVHIETETATATSTVKTKPTCTVKGTTTYTATFKNTAFAKQTKSVQNIAATGHNWNAVTYTWSSDNKTCTAKRVCKNNSAHVETQTVNTTSAVKTQPTCTVKGTTTYTATFTNSAFTKQTKSVQNIAATGHKWGGWINSGFDIAKGTRQQTRTCSVCKTKETKSIAGAVTRLAGGNRYGTAGEISKAMFDNKTNKATTVVLANGLVAADALAGVPLATKLGAPILLTTTDKVPDETMAEIKRLGAKKVVILGGTGAISEKVEKTLKDNGLTIERLAGKTRFETAAKIADKLQTETKKAPTEAFFVYYNSYADALSASTVAAIKEAPIFYVTTDGKLDDATKAQLDKIKSSVTKAYVIGGTGVISDNMKKNISTALGNKTVERVSGGNRYSTCVEVNNKFKSVLTGKAICVAKGLDFPDALAGGVFAAQNKAPLFLADNKLQDVQTEYLKSKKADSIYIFGGTGAVPDSLVQSIAQASI